MKLSYLKYLFIVSVIVWQIISPYKSICEIYSNEPYTLSSLADNFFTENKSLVNKYTLTLSTEIASIDAGILNPRFENLFGLGIEYGVMRIDTDFAWKGMKALSGESIYLSSLSSHLNPFSKNLQSKTLDAWRFGGFTKTGCASDNFLNGKLFFTHIYSIDWNRIDFEQINKQSPNSNILKKYDENLKLGTSWRIGADALISNNIIISAEYEKAHIIRNVDYAVMSGAYLFDNIFQRLPDFLEPAMIKIYKEKWLWFKIGYKNLLSFLMYNLRRNNYAYPFNGDKPLSREGFKILLKTSF